MKWTIVQHSGFGYGNKVGFKYGLEPRSLKTKASQNRVIKAGGVLYESYMAADDAAEGFMYPPGHRSIYPNCRPFGGFGRAKVDGLRLFIPKQEDV